MSAPIGEGIQQAGDLDTILRSTTLSFDLIEPKSAPTELLAAVRVNTEGQCLETDTSIGPVSVEVYWKEENRADATRGDLFSALNTELDPEASTNPIATQNYPYTIIPDGALYEVAMRVPLVATEHEWSDEHIMTLGGKFKYGGMSLALFQRMFPHVEVDLPAGLYEITATERKRPTLAIAARVENGEPLTRRQVIEGNSVHYSETLAAAFQPSVLRPDTAIGVIHSRVTIRGDGQDADRQMLEFRQHDGFQRTGQEAENHGGLIELILMQGIQVEYSSFTFKPYVIPSFERFGGGSALRGIDTFDGVFKSPTRSSGLLAGETRYRPPETVRVSTGGVMDLRPVAAFRFALAGAPTEETVA